ncbi:hypothetical protein GCM10010271_09510 [Streptomyces kurssanovii]|nr:hypothetical protein GCM10010271_09510 [Streptomyces kurssanovii]
MPTDEAESQLDRVTADGQAFRTRIGQRRRFGARQFSYVGALAHDCQITTGTTDMRSV